MTTYIIYNDNDEPLGTFDLKKQGKYWFLTAQTVKGPTHVATFKTKAKAEEHLKRICANGLTYFKLAMGVA